MKLWEVIKENWESVIGGTALAGVMAAQTIASYQPMVLVNTAQEAQIRDKDFSAKSISTAGNSYLYYRLVKSGGKSADYLFYTGPVENRECYDGKIKLGEVLQPRDGKVDLMVIETRTAQEEIDCRFNFFANQEECDRCNELLNKKRDEYRL